MNYDRRRKLNRISRLLVLIQILLLVAAISFEVIGASAIALILFYTDLIYSAITISIVYTLNRYEDIGVYSTFASIAELKRREEKRLAKENKKNVKDTRR